VWTQEDLAKASGVQVVTISRIENGKVAGRPRQSTIRKLAQALDVEASWLLFGRSELPGRDEI
jgi:transcriptional regulator with XRE-family HTH domain